MNKKNVLYIAITAIIILILIVCIGIRIFIYPLKYEQLVITYSQKYDIDPYLVFAIINTESNFDKDATSHKDAKGLMQITYETAKEMNEMTGTVENLTEDDLYEPSTNIELGCKYIATLIARYNGNYYLAICAYNAGIGNVNNWIDEDEISLTLDTTDIELPFSETTNYLKKVIHNYSMYKLIYPSIL